MQEMIVKDQFGYKKKGRSSKFSVVQYPIREWQLFESILTSYEAEWAVQVLGAQEMAQY